MREWAGQAYDPELFDREQVNESLRSLAKTITPKHIRPKADTAKEKKKKLTKPALTKYLKELSHEQLVELVKDCFGVSKDMERFLTVKILGDDAVDVLFAEYRQKVEKEFFPSRGEPKLRLQDAKKAIAEFEKLTGNTKRAAELRLVYVENGIEFIIMYGYFDERFYVSIASVYADVIKAALKDETNELYEGLREPLSKIVRNASRAHEWLYEDLYQMYCELGYDDEEEEDEEENNG